MLLPVQFGPSFLGGHLEKQPRLCQPRHKRWISVSREPRRIVSHSLTASLLSAALHVFECRGGGGGVGVGRARHLGWTESCCARYDSVALCLCLLPQALIFPKQLYEAIFEEELTTIKIFVRLYGATLLSKLEEEEADGV